MLRYLVTGATGLVGRHLVDRLLARPGTEVVHCLVRPASRNALAALWDDPRVRPLVGDLTAPGLGLTVLPAVDHVLHSAAEYDLQTTLDRAWRTNVLGTRHLLGALSGAEGRPVLHHVSTNGVAGRYVGRFYEHMLDEGQLVDHPYFLTKQQAEREVREHRGEVRVYRPSTIVGDSRTGAMPKVDGFMFAFEPLRRVAQVVPERLPLVGPRGTLAHIVPVDYVADCIGHIAHRPAAALPGSTFHVVDPAPVSVGAALNAIALAAGAPRCRVLVPPKVTRPLAAQVRRLPGAPRLRDRFWDTVGVPARVVDWRDFDASFDTTWLAAGLAGSGIACPPFASYVDRLYDHWERHLRPAALAAAA